MNIPRACQHLLSIVAITCSLVLGLGTGAAHSAEKARVLILGDSISIGYTPFVQKQLAKEAVVIRPMRGKGAENCAGTNNGVVNIDRWLKIDGGKWDVIHVNFGLHDLKHVDPKNGKNSNDPKQPHQASPEQYEKQLREITAKLKATGAKLIFATTTPVPQGGVSPFRDPADVVRYNAIAAKIMQEHDASINDLYKFAESRLAKIQRPANVHFTSEGSKALADEAVRHIRAALAKD